MTDGVSCVLGRSAESVVATAACDARLEGRNRSRAGFSMAEMLVAVAILVVLLGLGFVAVIQFRASLMQLELDSTAQEIYVAAQNHLTAAKSQGLLKRDIDEDDRGESGDASKDIYYFVSPPGNGYESVFDLMLPPSSIDETIRTGSISSYVVVYQLSTATVLDVFYAKTNGYAAYTFRNSSSLYEELMAVSGSDKADARRSYEGDSIIGWYGGEEGATYYDKFVPPVVEVKNADKLEVTVNNAKNEQIVSKPGTVAPAMLVTLVIEGEESQAEIWYKFKASEQASPYEVTLDDVTLGAGLGRFKEVVKAVPESNKLAGKAFIPGENLKIRAYVSADNTASGGSGDSRPLTSTVATSKTVVTNSLFATGKSPDASSDAFVATIASIRHLENLSPDVSGFEVSELGDPSGSLAKAMQETDLSWDAFRKSVVEGTGHSESQVSVYYDNPATLCSKPGTFLPVQANYELAYDGRAHVVSDVSIDTNGPAGLFSELTTEGSSVSNVQLCDFSVNTVEGLDREVASAGTLAGRIASGVHVANAFARTSLAAEAADYAVFGDVAGGLVGTVEGADAEEGAYTLDGCAACVYVGNVDAQNGEGLARVAGGLVGATQGSVRIRDSYAAGHTTSGFYNADDPDVAANAENGAAGGLVGQAAGALSVQYSYATTSVRGAHYAGGLIGDASSVTGGTVSNCYATGLVSNAQTDAAAEAEAAGTTAEAADNAGAFAANPGALTFADDSYYRIVNPKVGAVAGDEQDGVTAFDKDAATLDAFMRLERGAIPYDATLASHYSVADSAASDGGTANRSVKYPFKTIAELDGAVASAIEEAAEAAAADGQATGASGAAGAAGGASGSGDAGAAGSGNADGAGTDVGTQGEDTSSEGPKLLIHLGSHYGDWPLMETEVVNDPDSAVTPGGGGEGGEGGEGGGDTPTPGNVTATVIASHDAPFTIDDVLQIVISDGTASVSTADYGWAFEIIATEGEIVFDNNNQGITLLSAGTITLQVRLTQDIYGVADAGMETTVTITVTDEDDDATGDRVAIHKVHRTQESSQYFLEAVYEGNYVTPENYSVTVEPADGATVDGSRWVRTTRSSDGRNMSSVTFTKNGTYTVTMKGRSWSTAYAGLELTRTIEVTGLSN